MPQNSGEETGKADQTAARETAARETAAPSLGDPKLSAGEHDLLAGRHQPSSLIHIAKDGLLLSEAVPGTVLNGLGSLAVWQIAPHAVVNVHLLQQC